MINIHKDFKKMFYKLKFDLSACRVDVFIGGGGGGAFGLARLGSVSTRLWDGVGVSVRRDSGEGVWGVVVLWSSPTWRFLMWAYKNIFIYHMI